MAHVKWHPSLSVSASVLVFSLLGACSSIPDAVNPVEWYRSTVDMLSSDDETTDGMSETAQNDSVPGANSAFPDINDVPSSSGASSVLSSDGTGQGLIADPNKPEYATSIDRQSGDGLGEPANQVAQVAESDLQPAPPPQPVIPVEASSTMSELPPPEPEIMAQAGQPSTEIAQVRQADISNLLVIETGVLPSGESYDEYRARLMAGLNQTGSSFTTLNAIPAATTNISAQNTSFSTQSMNSGTLIISSLGVHNSGQYAQYSNVQPASDRSNAGYMKVTTQNGMPVLYSNSVRIATVHFSNGSSRLDNNDRKVLRQVIALQKQNGGVIQIIGHASSRTKSMEPIRHKMVNYQVSASRADAIANAMVRLGAVKETIMIGAVSDSQPLFYEVMPSGEAGNRRAEIYIGS